jgi:hypothetical protein
MPGDPDGLSWDGINPLPVVVITTPDNPGTFLQARNKGTETLLST